MPGNPRILDAGPVTLFDESITVTDATGFDFNTNLTASRLRNGTFHEVKISACFADLNRFHEGLFAEKNG
jgi:hypothetical protein